MPCRRRAATGRASTDWSSGARPRRSRGRRGGHAVSPQGGDGSTEYRLIERSETEAEPRKQIGDGSSEYRLIERSETEAEPRDGCRVAAGRRRVERAPIDRAERDRGGAEGRMPCRRRAA